MRCSDVQSQINALVDGELNAWDAARVRRHLKTCPACRAEFDAAQLLTVQARAWRDVAAPVALRARIADALTRQSPAQEDLSMPTATATVPLPARRPPTPRWRPLAGAGALAAVLAAAALLLPGSPGRPTAAFAAVRQAMRGVRAVSWTETQTRDKGGRVILHNTHQYWVRRDTPAVAEWDGASTLPQVPGEEYAGPTKSLSDARGLIYFHTQEGVYYLHPVSDIARQVADTIDGLTAKRADDYGRAERVTLDGHPALRFHQHQPDYDVTLWADPRTLRVVRKRTDEVAHFPTGTEHIVLDATGFRYDTPAPPGVFDLAPPPNARVTEDDGRGNRTLAMASSQEAGTASATPRVLTIIAMHPRGSSLMPADVSALLGSRGVTFAVDVREPVSRARQLEAFAARAGHDFLLVAPGRPSIRATLGGLTVADWGGPGGTFRGFGLRVAPGDVGKIVSRPATTYTLRPLNAGHVNRWAVDNSSGDVVLHFGG